MQARLLFFGLNAISGTGVGTFRRVIKLLYEPGIRHSWSSRLGVTSDLNKLTRKMGVRVQL